MIDRERLVLIGHPVTHSFSPVMHNAALAAAGSHVRYEKLDVPADQLGATLAELSHQQCGGNITFPHKKRAFDFVTRSSAVAEHVGAINTFWSDGLGTIDGDNTDVSGFDAAITELLGTMPDNARVAVLGAGGAAAAVLTAIDEWPGVTASVHARDLARAMSMRMRHSAVVRVCSMRDPCLADADIVINATPIGMGTDELPVELDRISESAVVFDLVYGPNETAWIRGARARGNLASDGLRMLLHQGVAAFQRWFATPPDADVMWQALLNETGRG